ERVQTAVHHESHPALAPDEVIGHPELGDQRAELDVRIQDHVVKALEGNTLVQEIRAETAELVARLEHDGNVAGLQEEVRRGETGDAAADDPDPEPQARAELVHVPTAWLRMIGSPSVMTTRSAGASTGRSWTVSRPFDSTTSRTPSSGWSPRLT